MILKLILHSHLCGHLFGGKMEGKNNLVFLHFTAADGFKKIFLILLNIF
jgi:hypothetical protein